MPIIGSKKVLKVLLQPEGTFYTDLVQEAEAYDFVYIQARRNEIAIARDTVVVIDSVNATGAECMGQISEDVLGLIQELLAANRQVLLMQHLHINDVRYPDYDLHREARLYLLDFLDKDEPTYIHISRDYKVYTYPLYPSIAYANFPV